MENKKFRLAATEAVEYNVNTGWIMADHVEQLSQTFDTRSEALGFKDEFIASLNISQRDAYEIQIHTVEVEVGGDGDETYLFVDGETLDMIDESESLRDYPYQANRYYGQYMIPQNKYFLDYTTSLCSTKNELFKHIEHGSFKSHPEEVFKTEEEVREWAEDKNVVSSVVKLNNDDQE